MSIRKVKLVSGEFYHIYNRGNSKQKIFHDEEDHLRFMGLLYACNQEGNLKVNNLNKGQTLYDIEREKPLVSIGAYCLMPNHFHLLLTSLEENNISNFMQKLSTSYSMYYNKKYQRTGSLFEGKFKSQHLDTDRYLKYIFSYIHLNPVKLIQKDWKENGIKNKKEGVDYLNKYSYSSHFDYLKEKRIQNKILKIEPFPKYFPNKNSFTREIFKWLKFS
jgi:REP element-mobilizing transposase RayT